MLADSQDLNQSKFLSEHLNLDQQPTEQQILERAQQLQIDDLNLARQTLTKELDSQWRPYINRKGQVYYINLQQRKAYIDHPIDMQAKISYALATKKTMPVFRQYAIRDIARSMVLIQAEIDLYERGKGLNIVYEESQEDSVRRQTQISQVHQQQALQAENYIQEEIQFQMARIKRNLQGHYRQELNNYKEMKNQRYQQRLKQHDSSLAEMKKQKLMIAEKECEKEWQERNQISLAKTVGSTIQELNNKQLRFEELADKQIKLIEDMQSYSEVESEIKQLARNKLINIKRQQAEKTRRQIWGKFQQKISYQLKHAHEEYQKDIKKVTFSRANIVDNIQQKMQGLAIHLTKNKVSKRRSIFGQKFVENLQSQLKIQQRLKRQLDLDRLKYQNSFTNSEPFVPFMKPSLPLRLMKKVL